jgi:enoyl-CoA hydratase/carnithine racemase
MMENRERNMQGERSLSDRVTVEVVDGVAEVTLDRPDKLNAVDPAMLEAIIAAGERLSQTAGLRAVVLAGAGKGFCAGLDKASFEAMAGGSRGKSSPISSPAPTGSPTHGSKRPMFGACFPFR